MIGEIKMIEKYIHHERMVAVQSHLRGKHREHCLCFARCKNFKPGEPDNCPIAQGLYEFDVKHGVTTPVFECPEYRTAE